MLRITIAIIILGFKISAQAGQTTLASPVTHYEYYKTHVGLLVVQSNMIDPDSCGRNTLYILSNTHPHYKEATALILAAHITGQPLKFHLNGCLQGLPSIEHIYSDK